MGLKLVKLYFWFIQSLDIHVHTKNMGLIPNLHLSIKKYPFLSSSSNKIMKLIHPLINQNPIYNFHKKGVSHQHKLKIHGRKYAQKFTNFFPCLFLFLSPHTPCIHIYMYERNTGLVVE